VEALKNKGITSVDVVIANAGINLSHDVKFIDIDVDHQMELFKFNVRSCSIPNDMYQLGWYTDV
jgi:short-subunit dehydrogenase